MADKEQKVAIFDIDGTLFRSSLLIELVDTLIDKGIFPADARDIYAKEHERWLERAGDYESYIGAVIEAFLTHLKGVHYGDFMDAADEVVERQKYYTYRYTRELITDLKEQGYFLLAISHSPKAILETFCREMGFDKVYGKLYQTGETGRFTGEVLEEHLIENKANVVKRAVEKENLTLKKSIGVGDTESDIPFLELVEKAICFNPNAKLYKYARINKWRIVVERKDVVYEL